MLEIDNNVGVKTYKLLKKMQEEQSPDKVEIISDMNKDMSTVKKTQKSNLSKLSDSMELRSVLTDSPA